jgi:hypothetical protein
MWSRVIRWIAGCKSLAWHAQPAVQIPLRAFHCMSAWLLYNMTIYGQLLIVHALQHTLCMSPQ